ncbi:MAG: hypothetical protein RR733_03980 [Victivallaceae bacterium]
MGPIATLLHYARLNNYEDSLVIRTLTDLNQSESSDHVLDKNGMLELAERENLSETVKAALREIGCVT